MASRYTDELTRGSTSRFVSQSVSQSGPIGRKSALMHRRSHRGYLLTGTFETHQQ